MQLWIDAGNTRLKWCLYSGNEYQAGGAILHRQNMNATIQTLIANDAFKQKLGNSSIFFVGVASVLNADTSISLMEALRHAFGVDPVRAYVTKELLGVSCAYEKPEKLGIDRWLALLAVYHSNQKLSCIISCGSAFTIDVVQADGKHLGGFILPGLQMSIDALFSGTHSVRFEADDRVLSVDFGVDTASAVSNGLLFQQVSVVARLKQLLLERYPGEVISFVLSGGDADKLGSLLSEEGVVDFAINQDLVIQGLRLALQSHTY